VDFDSRLDIVGRGRAINAINAIKEEKEAICGHVIEGKQRGGVGGHERHV